MMIIQTNVNSGLNPKVSRSKAHVPWHDALDFLPMSNCCTNHRYSSLQPNSRPRIMYAIFTVCLNIKSSNVSIVKAHTVLKRLQQDFTVAFQGLQEAVVLKAVKMSWQCAVQSLQKEVKKKKKGFHLLLLDWIHIAIILRTVIFL